jgi:pimeloyl-ACP methyl ester carboxylesterase
VSIASIRGVAIAYEDTGQGSPLVLVHGHPFDRSMWREQVRAFSSHCRVITFDLRGYGGTTVIPGTTSLEEFARDTAGLLDYLDVTDIILGGLSMGGQIVLEFYRLFPQRARALILSDTFAQLDTDERRQARYDTADRLVNEGMRRYADEVLTKMIAPRTLDEQPEVAAHVLSMMWGTPPEGAAAALRGRAERQDYTSLLPEIAVPTLIIVGSDDEFTPVSDAEFMRERIPNSQMVVIEKTGHIPNMEDPKEFNRVVEEFLRTLSQSSLTMTQLRSQ